ncbi:MAG: cysteine hydrolase [Bacteroidetes bacterium]|nr:cysteine hydrolase [Bacteroidota bacterium]
MDNKEIDNKAEVIQFLRHKTDQLISEWKREDILFDIKPPQAALIIIDMQNFVCAPENGHGIQGIDEVINNTNHLVDICHELSIPVIWVRENINTIGDSTNGGLYPLFHDREHLNAIENLGHGTEIYSEMHFDKSKDFVVFKNRYSAFIPAPSDLHKTLTSIGRKLLIISGVAANVCIESTVRDAMQLDYEVVLISDATTTFDEIFLEVTLMNTRLFFGDVRTTKSVIDELKSITKE